MFTTAEVMSILGVHFEALQALRRKSHILCLNYEGASHFPQFQFDNENRCVHPIIKSVGEHLNATNAPWGVTGWWTYRNGQLGAHSTC